jgi:hypothetical protein
MRKEEGKYVSEKGGRKMRRAAGKDVAEEGAGKDY